VPFRFNLHRYSEDGGGGRRMTMSPVPEEEYDTPFSSGGGYDEEVAFKRGFKPGAGATSIGGAVQVECG
jgi:hypothetical protein